MARRSNKSPSRTLRDDLLVEVKVLVSLDVSGYKGVHDPLIRSRIRTAFIKELDLLLSEGLSEDANVVSYSSKIIDFNTKSVKKPDTISNEED